MKVKGTNTYAQKRKANGADFYGAWREGAQQRADVVAGRVLTYDARMGRWF
jgi:hypothetical protein